MKSLLFLILIIIFILIALTIRTQLSSNQRIFLSGKIPSPGPDGLYRGTAEYTANWLGKKFDAKNNAGINLFRQTDGTTKEKYPFKTYTGKGIRDTGLDVIKIDYDMPGNPFWLRWILDEIVETAPNKYIGKLQLRIIPGFPFSLGYFFLEQ